MSVARVIYPLEVLLAAEARQNALLKENAAARARTGELPPEPYVERRWDPGPEEPLTPQQFLFLSLRYQECARLDEIAAILDVSKVRVAQIEMKALQKLSVASVRVLAKRISPLMARQLLDRSSAASPMKWRRLGETFA